MGSKINLLINLPKGFFNTPELKPCYDRLARFAEIRCTSHNTIEELEPELFWPDAILMWAWPNFTDASLEKAGKVKFIGHINTTQTQARAEFKHGIKASDVRHAWSPSVAELALGLALDGLRKISAFHIGMRDGTEAWLKDIPADIDPEERQLAGRKVGVVGFGRIGQRLAELMAPFAVDLVVYDPYIPETVLQKYGAARVDTTLELANRSEVIVLCAANNEGSRHLIGREEIAALRPGCILVNVGRSSLMDMDALVERLGKGDITAMLDVFDSEPLEMDSSLRSLPNAFLTPHRGGGIMESITRSLALLTDDLEAVLEGREQKYALTESMMVSLPD